MELRPLRPLPPLLPRPLPPPLPMARVRHHLRRQEERKHCQTQPAIRSRLHSLLDRGQHLHPERRRRLEGLHERRWWSGSRKPRPQNHLTATLATAERGAFPRVLLASGLARSVPSRSYACLPPPPPVGCWGTQGRTEASSPAFAGPRGLETSAAQAPAAHSPGFGFWRAGPSKTSTSRTAVAASPEGVVDPPPPHRSRRSRPRRPAWPTAAAACPSPSCACRERPRAWGASCGSC